MRRFIAAALAAAIVAAGIGCSQPVDTGSPVPAASQPFVALLALIGLAIGVTAFEHHAGRGAMPSPTPSGSGGLTPPLLVVRFSSPASDMNIGGAGALVAGVIEPGASATRYEQVVVPSSTQTFGFTLPAGYNATALAIDGSGNVWFDDTAGNLKECAAPTSSSGACMPIASLSDGIAKTGTRSMDADSANLFVAVDNGASGTAYAQFSLPGGVPNASGNVPGTALLAGDAVTETDFVTTTTSFTCFRTDGSSFVFQSGSAADNPFSLSPAPNSAPGNPTVSQDASLAEIFFGLLGTTSGAYQIARYSGANGAEQASITIAQGGQTSGNLFTVPLKSLRADLQRDTFALDASGQLVEFSSF